MNGTYADMIAISNVEPGTVFIVTSGTNVGNKYEYRGAIAGWVQTHDSTGAILTVVTTLPEGVLPGDKKIQGSAMLAASGAGSTLSTPDISDLESMTFKITGLGAETVNLTFYLDAAKTIATATVRPIDLNTGALHTSSNLPNGSYFIEKFAGNFGLFSHTGTDTPTITYFIWG